MSVNAYRIMNIVPESWALFSLDLNEFAVIHEASMNHRRNWRKIIFLRPKRKYVSADLFITLLIAYSVKLAIACYKWHAHFCTTESEAVCFRFSELKLG